MPPMNAISLLEKDHVTVKKLLSQLEKTTDRSKGKREELLAKIATELETHAQIEEEIFYPAFREAVRTKEGQKLFFEAAEEHHLVKIVLPELQETDTGGPEFGAKAKVLKELVEHHADEEEEEMFPKARKAFDAEELVELGQRMQARKDELLGTPGRSKKNAGRARLQRA